MHVSSLDKLEPFVTKDGSEIRELAVGDCAVIPPGERHTILNTGDGPLRILCCCAPAYTHEDTVITGDLS